MANPGTIVLSDLSAHLQKVDEDPATALDIHLLEQCELFTSTPEYRSSIWTETRPLFLQIAALLPNLQQDPAPLTRFITKLATPYRFADIKDIDFEIGLHLEAQPFHSLILSLLKKAAVSSTDAQCLANRPTVISAIVRLWLCTPDTAIATQAADLLTSLLRISKNEPGPVPGEAQLYHYGTAPIWKRLFNDRDIYMLYYQYTTVVQLAAPGEPLLSKRERTIAQARLLEWLPQVGTMDWNTVTSSHEPAIEREVGLSEGQGLLHYASLKMVDTADDILMHLTLISFFTDLITTVRTSPHLTRYDSSLSLDFVTQHGIHKTIIDIYTNDDPGLERSFLGSQTALYIAQYVSTYPDNFENSAELQTIRQCIHRNIRKCDANDLSIVAAMPRSSLVPRTSSGMAWDDCILLDIPITRTNPEALKTLAAVFRGPPKDEITFPPSAGEGATSNRTLVEKVYARLLTSLYYTKNPSLFSEIVKHAETVAIKENALASLFLLRAILTSNWDSGPIPDKIPDSDPIYLRLQEFPPSGLAVVLDPTISGGVLPYLLKPASSFSNLVGGRGGAENPAYQVALAKFDVLKVLDEKLLKEGGRHEVVNMVRRRVVEGPWSVAEGVGSQIGTLEL